MTFILHKNAVFGACAAGALLTLFGAAALAPRSSGPSSGSSVIKPAPPDTDPGALESEGRPRSDLARGGEPRVFSRAQASDEPEPRQVVPEPIGSAEAQALLESAEQEAALSAKDRARLLRLPLISAIRGNHPDGHARHRAMREALSGSGPSDEPWTNQARSVFESWNAALTGEEARHLDPSSLRCFRAGCEVVVTFLDLESYESAAREFRAIREGKAGHGGRVLTPALATGDGRVRAAWMLLRPDDAG